MLCQEPGQVPCPLSSGRVSTTSKLDASLNRNQRHHHHRRHHQRHRQRSRDPRWTRVPNPLQARISCASKTSILVIRGASGQEVASRRPIKRSQYSRPSSWCFGCAGGFASDPTLTPGFPIFFFYSLLDLLSCFCYSVSIFLHFSEFFLGF